MEWFKFVDGAVVLDKDAIALYPNVRKLLTRDHGGTCVGDPDGRKKERAFRELTYVYFRCDYRMYPSQHGLNEAETHLYAAIHSKLGKDYKPDDLVLAIAKQYEEEHLSQTKRTIKSLLRTFALTDKIIIRIESTLTATLDLPQLNAAQIKELLDLQGQVFKTATELPTVAKKLREAMNALEEEEKIKDIIRGGEEKPDSMDPNNKIESED